jgi:adsorption protein B
VLQEIFIVLTAIVAVSFLASGIDDFFIDAFYWIWLFYRKVFLRHTIRPIRQQVLVSIPEKWTAIWIPAWHESEVIAKMIAHTIQCMNYENFDIFVGTYPNDQLTQDAVESVCLRFPLKWKKSFVPTQVRPTRPTV